MLLLSKAEDRGAAPHARDASFALLYLVAGPRYTQQASALPPPPPPPVLSGHVSSFPPY